MGAGTSEQILVEGCFSSVPVGISISMELNIIGSHPQKQDAHPYSANGSPQN